MANLIERAMDLLKLTYDEYEEDEYEEEYNEPVKKRQKKTMEEEKTEDTDSFYEEEKNTQNWGQSTRKKTRGKTQAEGFSSNSKVERAPVRFGSNVSVVRGGNSMESEIVSIRPKDDKARQEIGTRLLEGKTVLINLEGLELDVAQRIVDFTFGVCFAIKGNMKFPSKYIVIAVPDEVGLSGVFENSSESSSQRASSKMSFDN